MIKDLIVLLVDDLKNDVLCPKVPKFVGEKLNLVTSTKLLLACTNSIKIIAPFS